MKKNLHILGIGVVASAMLCASTLSNHNTEVVEDINAVNLVQLRKVDHQVFKPGEKLTYNIHYGIMNAGNAELEVKSTDRKALGRDMLHLTGVGKTIGAFEWFYEVDDRYDSFIDEEGVFPWVFRRRVNEGNYVINQDYLFRQHEQMVRTKEEKGHKDRVKQKPDREFEVPPSVQDMLSSFYYARTIDFSHAQKGDIFEMDCFLDGEIWPLKVKYLGKETIKTKTGKWRCMKFAPIVQKGRIFKKEEDLMVWVSDDGNKIPVRAKANILVGSIKMDLVTYEGMANPSAVSED